MQSEKGVGHSDDIAEGPLRDETVNSMVGPGGVLVLLRGDRHLERTGPPCSSPASATTPHERRSPVPIYDAGFNGISYCLSNTRTYWT